MLRVTVLPPPPFVLIGDGLGLEGVASFRDVAGG
jgi:hypothetical protein